MELGQMAVIFSDQVRALLTSSQLKPPMLACLRAATEAALFNPELAELAKRQKIIVQPSGAMATQNKISFIDQSLRQHGPYFQSLVNTWKTNH